MGSNQFQDWEDYVGIASWRTGVLPKWVGGLIALGAFAFFLFQAPAFYERCGYDLLAHSKIFRRSPAILYA